MKKWKALTVFGMVCALAAMPVLTFAGPSKESEARTFAKLIHLGREQVLLRIQVAPMEG